MMRERKRTHWHPCRTVIMVTVVVACGGKGARGIIIVGWVSARMSTHAHADAGGTICAAT